MQRHERSSPVPSPPSAGERVRVRGPSECAPNAQYHIPGAQYAVPRTPYSVLQTLSLRLRTTTTALIAALLLASDAQACAIPVFRFALERWASDLYEVDVFYRGELNAEQREQLAAIEDRSLVNGGNVNLEVVRCLLDGPLDDDLKTVWAGLGEVSLPHVVVRAPGARHGSPQVWSGRLAGFAPDHSDSPARQELVRRLLAGDSVVWLVLPGTDAEAARDVTQRLSAALATLETEIEIPQGIGLPGSELAAQVPLAVKFSVLTAKPDAESALRQQIAAQFGDEVAASETLVVPVFGRGRALQTFLADEVDDDTIAEVSRFLCAACSCQVKQLNPGFDLLLAVNWDERLYAPGESVPTEPPPGDDPAVAEYVAIPAGSVDEAVPETPLSQETSVALVEPGAPPVSPGIFVLAALGVGLAAGAAGLRKTPS